MGEIIALGVLALSVPVAAYTGYRAKRRQRARWAAAAQAAGMEDVVPATSIWFKTMITARAGRHPVRVDEFAHSRYNRGTRVVIEGNSGLTLRSERDISAMQRAVGPREIELGDEGFDREVYVEGGDPPVLRALLDVETRGVVRRFLDGLLRLPGEEGGMVAAKAAVQDGCVVFEVPSGADRVLCADFTQLIKGPLELARRLERPQGGIAQRLAETTSREPNPAMRVEDYKLLARYFPHHPAARELLEQGCEDEAQEIQLHSALGLGVDDAQGRAKLMEIATRGWSDDPVAGRAIVALGAKLAPDECAAMLSHALRTRADEKATACLQVLGASQSPAAVEPLARVLRMDEGPLAAAAARALAACGQPAGEEPLLRALRSRDARVRLAAVESLATLGSAAAVLPLKDAAERDGGLKSAVRQAVAAIQERVGGSPGQVSLTGSGSGLLTLSEDDPGGRLSMEKPEP
jgi:hypothetical protein